MYLAYSLLALLVLVVVSPYFAYQAIRHRKYIGSLGQRLGYLPVSFNVDGEESIWIHAVSVGEVLTVWIQESGQTDVRLVTVRPR